MEFKSVPRDLVSSLRQSARMSRQMIDLGSNDGPSVLFLIGQPKFEWRYDQTTGERLFMLIDPENHGPRRYTGLTYGELKLRELTLFMIGVWPCYVPSWEVMPETVCEFYHLFQQKEHRSHLVRPSFGGGNIMRSWPKPGKGDLILHIFQGFETVGLKKAEALWSNFEDFRTFAIAGEEYYRKIPGIGRETARKIEQQMTASWHDFQRRGKDGSSPS